MLLLYYYAPDRRTSVLDPRHDLPCCLTFRPLLATCWPGPTREGEVLITPPKTERTRTGFVPYVLFVIQLRKRSNVHGATCLYHILTRHLPGTYLPDSPGRLAGTLGRARGFEG